MIHTTKLFDRWMRRLGDAHARARIAERIQRLGNGLTSDVKHVGADVSELRIHCGPGYRVYFTRQGRQLIILLCAGDKDTQMDDIKMAQRMAADLSRAS